jgi:hypothetical protein
MKEFYNKHKEEISETLKAIENGEKELERLHIKLHAHKITLDRLK